QLTAAAVSGKGSALRVESGAGMGRTRLLEEVAVRARLAGATVVSIDAAMSRQLQGTAHALVARAFELLPELAAQQAAAFGPALAVFGDEFTEPRTAPRESQRAAKLPPRPLAEFFAEISQYRPLVIAVDNVEEADDASQGLLASLALLAPRHPLLVISAEATKGEPSQAIGLIALRRHSQTLALRGLSSHEMLELCRSIFADAPNLERFAEWLQERAAGSPLHAIEICRQLLARGVIRYTRGLWTLPQDRPNAELPSALGDALSVRLSTLSAPARELAECLSLQRDQPTLALCTLLCGDAEDPAQRARTLLDELGRNHVLYAQLQAYRFSSSALRSALLRDTSGERLEKHHRRLGEALSQLAPGDRALQIEAGFHFIEGDEAVRGAEMIARATHDSSKFRALVANLYHAGRPVEAACNVYQRHRRSLYELAPLLAALAQVGYYESRYFGERYGDQALDVLEDLCGLQTARRLQRYLGRMLALIIGLTGAWFRFVLTPRALRPYGFGQLFQQLFATVPSLAGVAALSLDGPRAERVAATLEPFGFLPEWTTPVGIYQLCRGLSEIARENEVEAYATFQVLLSRFENPRFYPSLPRDSRTLLLAGVHFARGSFALFRAHGEAALESANALEATGLRLYAMIASQLRFLYHAARGEFTLAAPHRDQLELHAAHVGSVWQVETWEGAALILIHAIAIGDVVNATRLVHRLEALSRSVPSLKRYSRLAGGALLTVQLDKRYLKDMVETYGMAADRSYIGWAATQGAIARCYNYIGAYAEAKALTDRALVHVTDADRELVALFLPLDLAAAVADAGLGQVDRGLARIDALLERFAGCDHPLLQGLLHEARAQICWEAKRVAEYEHSAALVERWFRPTGAPALIAKYERLVSLSNTTKSKHVPAANENAVDMETVATEAPSRSEPPAIS
ncbi:MAG TPA: AAA family ATPase, partial [Polyangiales bacterium]|nr:AAA family ATPase [Polyangiales bacterium]